MVVYVPSCEERVFRDARAVLGLYLVSMKLLHPPRAPSGAGARARRCFERMKPLLFSFVLWELNAVSFEYYGAFLLEEPVHYLKPRDDFRWRTHGIQ